MNGFQVTHILVRYGEIGLKGRNQPVFRTKLQKNLELRLQALGKGWPVKETRGYLLIDVPEEERDNVSSLLPELQKVFGIVSISPVMTIPLDRTAPNRREAFFSAIHFPLIDLAKRWYRPNHSFAVRLRRLDKTFPLNSNEIERELGAIIIQNTDWQNVNLTRPDCLIQCHLFADKVFLFTEKLPGRSGLPIGTVGKVLTLLSGGIDSPVAAYLMAKRGCQVDFIHFTATMMQHKEALHYKIARLAGYLSTFTQHSRLYLVPYIHFDMAVFGQNAEYELVLFRRFMMRTAAKLAEQIGAEALVTGDNLAQVASQTLPNLVSTSRATEYPIFRPLLAYDKQEIVNLAQQIGTYETSIEPYKDCCALISRHPKTRSKHENLEQLESRLFGEEYDSLIQKTLSDAVVLEFKLGTRIEKHENALKEK